MKEKENHLETLEFHPIQSTESSNRKTNPQKEKDCQAPDSSQIYNPRSPKRGKQVVSEGKWGRTVEMQSAPISYQQGSTRCPNQHATGIKAAINGQKKGEKEKNVYVYRPSEI